MIPQLRAWQDRYQTKGLAIVGVHTPEFLWERSYDNVASAVQKLGIRYAVVQDNDSEIWKRFGVWGWPTIILIGKNGTIRYQHIGEGGYEQTESWIRHLLAEGS